MATIYAFFKGEAAEGPARIFLFYDMATHGVRYTDWKLSFKTIKGNLFTGWKNRPTSLVTNFAQDRGRNT